MDQDSHFNDTHQNGNLFLCRKYTLNFLQNKTIKRTAAKFGTCSAKLELKIKIDRLIWRIIHIPPQTFDKFMAWLPKDLNHSAPSTRDFRAHLRFDSYISLT